MVNYNRFDIIMFIVLVSSSFFVGVRIGIEGALRIIRNNILGQARDEHER